MLVAFILFLREGLEASLIVGILMAILQQTGQRRYMSAVWVGVVLAVLASGGLGFLLYESASLFQGVLLTFKAITFLVAVVIITWMTFWMQQHSRTMKQEMLNQIGSTSSALALGLLAFSTVGREGVETVIFSLSFLFQSDGLSFLLGGVLGTLVAVALGVLVYGFGYRLNYRLFFRIMGLLLIVLAAGLLSNTIQSFQATGWLPFTEPLWYTGDVLSELDGLGNILHTFLGYTDSPTLLQIIGYVAYLLIAGGLFWWQTRKPVKRAPASTSSESITESSVARQSN